MPDVLPETSNGRSARWSIVLDHLATSGRLTVGAAAKLLNVSEATVRRDFTELAEQQLVTRTHGGVVATTVTYDLPYRYRSARSGDPRAGVARAAAALLPTGSAIAFNGGRTTTETARQFCARDDLGVGTTIVTNALNIAAEAVLRPHVRCVALGGVARPESYELTGPLAAATLEHLWLDVAVLGVNAISVTEGATCRLEDEAAIVSAMIERARRVVVVATGDKVGGQTMASICAASAVDVLVTTDDAPPAEVAALRAAGVEVTLV